MEIGVDRGHAHFLVKSVPVYNQGCDGAGAGGQTEAVGREFWGKGYFVNTVGEHGSEKAIAEYVKRQGKDSGYRRLHKQQLKLGF